MTVKELIEILKMCDPRAIVPLAATRAIWNILGSGNDYIRFIEDANIPGSYSQDEEYDKVMMGIVFHRKG